jgi:poly-gamma-glutamate capsule biosynthesis protein CapA/YwtB (metallophosphatase superfamily)
MRGGRVGLLGTLALCVGLAACSGGAGEAGGSVEAAAPRTHTPVTIAFAGDVHFAGVLADRLSDPATAMGPLTEVLAGADLGVLNLETAVTTRGAAQAKQFTFRAPPVVFDALKDAGVDVVTMANNHALDYGPSSVPDALAAAQQAGMPVVGLGADDQQAFAPWVTTVKGERIAVLGATAVVDDSLVRTWSAGPGQPGVATALDGQNQRLVDAVRAARATADTVVVELHYGKDLTTCPTAVQRRLVDDLVAAGADIIVGQHAHVLLGGGYLGAAYVHYGMGNFQFYASNGGTKSETGVLVLTAAGRAVSGATWHPGRIVDGLPTPLTGTAAAAATTRWEGLRACAGLAAEPTPQAG